MNNKFLLTIAAVFGLAFAAEAQTVSVGPRVGVNFATLRAVGGDGDMREVYNKGINYTTGAQVGVVANVGINEKFSIQPELLYSQKGFQTDLTVTEGEGGYLKLKTNYLEVPVLAKFSFGTGDVQGFVTAGPYVGYWMGGKTKLKIEGKKEEEDYEFSDGYDEYGVKENRLDLGASVGVGIAYRVGPGALNLEARYGYGFSDFTKYKDGRPDEAIKVSNRVIGVSLAYLFRL